MNWEALGTLAEIVSATTVLITLIYLAIQTRLTRLAVEESSKHATQQAMNSAVSMYSNWRALAISNSDIADLLAKSESREELLPKEVIALRIYFNDLFFVSAAVFRSGYYAASDHKASADSTHVAFMLNKYPEAMAEWIQVKGLVANICGDLVVEVEKLLASNENNE